MRTVLHRWRSSLTDIKFMLGLESVLQRCGGHFLGSCSILTKREPRKWPSQRRKTLYNPNMNLKLRVNMNLKNDSRSIC